jgi:hypothetical protein
MQEQLQVVQGDGWWHAPLPIPATDMADFVPLLADRCGYTVHYMAPQLGQASATRQRHYHGPPGFGQSTEHRLSLRWRAVDEHHTHLQWRVEIRKGLLAGRLDHFSGQELARQLPDTVQVWWRKRLGSLQRDLVLGPGGKLAGVFAGSLYDYSGCAPLPKLADLQTGSLPLGRYVSLPAVSEGWPPPASLGPMLYLPQGMEHKGTLVCAPPGAGKTEFVLRWAQAAIAHGYCVLVVDVKGNMYAKLQARLGEARAARALYRFSTHPDVTDCDRINFLADLDIATDEGRQGIERLAHALVPREGFEEGEQSIYYANRLSWVTGFIGLVKLHEEYCPDPKRDHDMSDVYDIAANRAKLYRMLDEIEVAEERRRAKGLPVVDPGLDYWFEKLVLLVGPDELIQHRANSADPIVQRLPPRYGERGPRETYRGLTQNLLTNALTSFDRYRTGIYPKISGESRPGERHFRLADLAGPDPVALVLEVPAASVGDADTMLSVAIAWLESLVVERFYQARGKRLQPVLLLLDETRRIRGFDAERYIAFAREAQAGVVIVYQDLDQVAEEEGGQRKINSLLRVTGTQIYLHSVSGNTYEYLMHQLGKVWRTRYEETQTPSATGISRSTRTVQEQVSYFDALALRRLPGGAYPALVYLRDHPSGTPFLVDMHNDHFEPVLGAARTIPARRTGTTGLRLPPAARAALEASKHRAN